jgi:hypothetical protein
MDQLAAGELALGRLDRAVQLPSLADSDDALERHPTFLAGELVDDVDDADRVNGDGVLLRQQPLGFDIADDVGDRGDVGAGRCAVPNTYLRDANYPRRCCICATLGIANSKRSFCTKLYG